MAGCSIREGIEELVNFLNFTESGMSFAAIFSIQPENFMYVLG